VNSGAKVFTNVLLPHWRGPSSATTGVSVSAVAKAGRIDLA
jgi:hypothetical protein